MKSCLYTGRVSHHRFSPRAHRFAYGISMAMVDLAHCDGREYLPAWLRLLLPLRRRDHLRDYQSGTNAPLGDVLVQLVRDRSGIRLDPRGRIFLLTGFGFLWHRFNPVSFYFCEDEDGRLRCLVAEVTNTPWGEQSHYVLDARGQSDRAEMRFRCAKDFHVSPFMPMDTCYHWRLAPPGDRAFINIAVERQGRPLFSATLNMDRRPLTARRVLAALARQPLMSLSVSWRIRWQALRLWLKAAPFYPHPRYTSGDQ